MGEDALALLNSPSSTTGISSLTTPAANGSAGTNTIWRRDADEYVLDCTRALIRSHKLGRIRTATSIERAARTDRRLARDHTAWNADPMLLGTPGDVVDLRDGELLAPDAAYMVNLSAGVRPAPQGAPHPLWTQFLKEATCNDAELQRYLQAARRLLADRRHQPRGFRFLLRPGRQRQGRVPENHRLHHGRLCAGRADQPVHGFPARRAPVRARPPGARPAGDRVRAGGKPQLGDRQDQAAHRQRGPHCRPPHAPELFRVPAALQAGVRRQYQAAHCLRGRGAGAPAQPGAVPVPAGNTRRAIEGKAGRRIPGDPALGDRRLARPAEPTAGVARQSLPARPRNTSTTKT